MDGGSDAPVSDGRTRILFVPGELLGADLRSTLAERRSLDVRTAADYRAALHASASWAPDLIVLRSEIGGHEASEFCRAVHAQASGTTPSLLMVTERLRVAMQVDTPCDAHLVSPVACEQMLLTIAELLDIAARRNERAGLDVLVHSEGFGDDGAAVDSSLSSGVQLSEHSMLIEAGRHLRIGARGRLQFFLPGTTERLTVDARVRVAVDEIRLLYVVEFVDLAPQHRSLIRGYIQSQSVAA